MTVITAISILLQSYTAAKNSRVSKAFVCGIVLDTIRDGLENLQFVSISQVPTYLSAFIILPS